MDTRLTAYLELSYRYYMEDRLDISMQVVQDAFATAGWPAGGWDEFYNELVCEKDARDASDSQEADGLVIELDRGSTEFAGIVKSAALDARAHITDALKVDLTRKTMITVFLPDAAVDFISGSYGYVSHKTTLDKICIPHRSVLSYPAAFHTLVHEFSHVAAFALGGHNVPTWLDEGLAMCLGGDTTASNDPVTVDLAHHYRDLLTGSRITGALDSRDLRKDDPMRVLAGYDLAGSLVAWWIENYGKESVRQALAHLSDDDNPNHAVHSATRISLGEMEKRWRKSLGL